MGWRWCEAVMMREQFLAWKWVRASGQHVGKVGRAASQANRESLPQGKPLTRHKSERWLRAHPIVSSSTEPAGRRACGERARAIEDGMG